MSEAAGTIGQAKITKFLNGFSARSFGNAILQDCDLFGQPRPLCDQGIRRQVLVERPWIGASAFATAPA